MDAFVVEGTKRKIPLKGNITIGGSKNGVLPLLAATLLGNTTSIIKNIPYVSDVKTFLDVIQYTGTKVFFDKKNRSVSIDPSFLSEPTAPYNLVRKMRASFYMLGALLGRCGYAKVSLPGGCALGLRPVNLHIDGLKAMGVDISLESGYVIGKVVSSKLHNAEYYLNPSSMGASVNLSLFAVCHPIELILHNVAIEPEITHFLKMLKNMGAHIEGIGTTTLYIKGGKKLKSITYTNRSDRIETGTYATLAAMIPNSTITLTNTHNEELSYFLNLLKKTGTYVHEAENNLTIRGVENLFPISICTDKYPGFPTDLQAQWAVLMTQSNGLSTITETIYRERFNYVPELVRMAADITVKKHVAYIKGGKKLQASTVMSTDLRASVSLIMAAIVANNTSIIKRVYHLDRGYESLEKKLRQIGVNIKRIIE